MSMAVYIEQKTKELRARREAESRAKLAAEWIDWSDRREAAESRGEPFDEPEPDSEEAIRRKREALESRFLYRLKTHWVWPHIMILLVVCLVIDIIALGYGIVWLVRYVAGIEGSGTVFLISTSALLLMGTYWLLYKFFRWLFREDERDSGARLPDNARGSLRWGGRLHQKKIPSHPRSGLCYAGYYV